MYRKFKTVVTMLSKFKEKFGFDKGHFHAGVQIINFINGWFRAISHPKKTARDFTISDLTASFRDGHS